MAYTLAQIDSKTWEYTLTGTVHYATVHSATISTFKDAKGNIIGVSYIGHKK